MKKKQPVRVIYDKENGAPTQQELDFIEELEKAVNKELELEQERAYNRLSKFGYCGIPTDKPMPE